MKPFNTKDRLLEELKVATSSSNSKKEDLENVKEVIENLTNEDYKDCHWRLIWDDIEDGFSMTTCDVAMMAYCDLYFSDGQIRINGGTESCGVYLDNNESSTDLTSRSFCADEQYSIDGVKRLLEQWHDFRVSLYKTFFQEILD